MQNIAPLDRAAKPNQFMAQMHRWNFSVLAAAAVMSAGFYTSDALALALGRVTVQSALGEPLRAEIDLPQITAEEADSLRAAPGSIELFRAQGMEYSSALNGVQISLQRRPDGRAVLRLSGDRPINEPFVDLVLDATWNSGRLVRSYTMLFDPPALRRPAPAVTAQAQTTEPSPAARPSAPAAMPAAAPRAPEPASPARPTASARPAQPPAEGVSVKPGDTASRLASSYRPAGVSLDQMLVAMMRSNPEAFIQGNVNRIKAGSVLRMPDAAAAQTTPDEEARQIIATQSRDFNNYRRQLAGQAPSTKTDGNERSVSGKVQARVDDKKPSAATPDRLTLSKGSVQDAKAQEEQLAREKQARETSTRIAELSKNITDLNRLNAASAPAGTAPAAPAAAAAASSPAVSAGPVAALAPAVPASAEVAPAAAAVSAPASTPAESPAPAASSPPAPAVAKPIVPPPPVEDPSFIDGLMADPMVPAAGGGLLALLLGLGAYQWLKRRRNANHVDSSFLESRIQPDSFFGASGGQRVDTASSDLASSSSMAYSPSQLDAGGDVDPVAEADVYLAYGRDLQAEEILKEAIRHNPGRVSVHAKLAEIYAKRQDRVALAASAGEVFKLTQGVGPEWARVVDLGQSLDPDNALYQPDGPAPLAANVAAAPTATPAAPAPALPSDLDLDLDLNLDLPDSPAADAPAAPGGFAVAAAAAGAMAAAPASPVESERASGPADGGMPDLMEPRWDMPDDTSAPTAVAEAPVAPPAPDLMSPDLDFPLDDLIAPPPADSPAPASTASLSSDDSPLEFDLGDLSLDLDPPQRATAPAEVVPSDVAADAGLDADQALAADDPLATKLALAEEFNAIGDTDGARTLIEEVVAEASGGLKSRAQRMLAELG